MVPEPVFKEEPIEVWSSVFVAVLLMVVSVYSSWAAASLGPLASFHLTNGIVSSWIGFLGIPISVLTTLLAWRGYGLNAIAVYLGGVSVASAFMGTQSNKLSAVILISMSVLVGSIRFTRHLFEYNPFKAFMSLWGLTFATSMMQSFLYMALFDHSYPLQGVLLLKLIMFGLGGLTVLFTIPRQNKEYVI
jgi:hypothetical protein